MSSRFRHILSSSPFGGRPAVLLWALFAWTCAGTEEPPPAPGKSPNVLLVTIEGRVDIRDPGGSGFASRAPGHRGLPHLRHHREPADVPEAGVLSGLASVDYVVFFGDSTPNKVIEKIVPHVLVKGGDWKPSRIVGAEFVKSHKGKVRSLKFLKGRSTTKTIKKIGKK